MTSIRNLILLVALAIIAATAVAARAEDLAGGNCPNARGVCIATPCGDINGDGKVLVSDAQALLYLVAGLAQPGDVTSYGTICEATACNEGGCYTKIIDEEGVCLFTPEDRDAGRCD